MNDLLEWPVTAWDPRQQAKVKHRIKDITAIVFFAELANASEWIEIYLFAAAREEVLREYLELPCGIPSHDTIQRVFANEYLLRIPARLESHLTFLICWNSL